jgi:hypothetical protein
MGIQRTAAGGIPSMTVPKEARVDSPDYTAAELLLQNISTHENAYMILKDGWTFTMTDIKFNADQIQKAIDGLNTGMALSVLAQFVLLGQGGNTGAFALSRDQSDFFLDGLQYIINLIEQNFNRYVIRPFIKINFGDGIDVSRIQLKGLNLNKKAGTELAGVLQTLKGAGFITATVDDEIQLRKALEMNPLSEEEVAMRKEARQFAHDNIINPSDNQGDVQEDDPEQETPSDKDPNAKTVKFTETKAKIRSQIIDSANEEMMNFMKANLMLIKDKLMADIGNTLNRGVVEIQGLKNIEVSYGKYQKAL